MRLYDSLTRGKVELPEPPGPIRMYVCGSTVYHRVHVGNARPFVLAMWLRSWLKQSGYDVKLVHNITDVDDKVYVEAAAREVASRDLAEWATGWFVEDTDGLGLGRPDVEPRASETMPEIIAFIEELLAGDLAYVAEGDVYFRVARFADYGRLSGAKLDEMVAQEPNELKEDPRDFALWKAQKPNEDAAWDSPWGPGRPGWHIECSAMAEKHLGPAFEIHGGGLDLLFPHHENERAQSCSLGHPYAQIWMHNGMLELDAEKMSKSLGNVVTLQNVLETWGRETLLVYLLTAHWRKPVDFTDEVLAQAAAQAEAFRNVFRSPSERGAGRLLGAFRGRARRRLQHSRRAGRHARMARSRAARAGARSLRARARSRSGQRRPRRPLRLPSSASRRARCATSRKPIGCAARLRRSAGRCVTWPTAFSSCRYDPRARLRAPARVRGVTRPA